VADTVEGFIQAATAPTAVGQVINLGTGQTVSIGELVELILEILGEPKTVLAEAARTRPEASEVWHLESDNRKAKTVLGWQPQISLREGLTRTIAYIREHLDHYKPDIYNL
jgi:nucleoside-diphosphate-sugar epimerase